MENFIQNLTAKKIFFICIILMAFHLLWSLFVCYEVIPHLPARPGVSGNTAKAEDLTSWYGMLVDIPLCAILEEMVFRVFPMGVWLIITGLISMHTTIKNSILITIVLSSSILFGWLHGNMYNVLMQGVGGIVYFIIFLIVYFKMEERNDSLAAIISITVPSVCHMTFNWSVVGLSLLGI